MHHSRHRQGDPLLINRRDLEGATHGLVPAGKLLNAFNYDSRAISMSPRSRSPRAGGGQTQQPGGGLSMRGQVQAQAHLQSYMNRSVDSITERVGEHGGFQAGEVKASPRNRDGSPLQARGSVTLSPTPSGLEQTSPLLRKNSIAMDGSTFLHGVMDRGSREPMPRHEEHVKAPMQFVLN